MNTIIEKIRAEIKIRLSANGAFDEEGDSAWHYDQGMIDAYNYILSFLSTLESEKPMQEGLEEEIVKVCDDFAFPLYGLADDYGRELINNIARHFAQWQKQHDAELIEIAYNDGITIGMTKQKEQMMKDAVEGGVVNTNYPTQIQLNIFDSSLKDGQKVKIIIVKEEGK